MLLQTPARHNKRGKKRRKYRCEVDKGSSMPFGSPYLALMPDANLG